MAAETAIFGAALGTGTALLIAVTIIMYKYYRLKQKTKEWHSLDQLPFPVVTEKNSKSFYPYQRTVSMQTFSPDTYFFLYIEKQTSLMQFLCS